MAKTKWPIAIPLAILLLGAPAWGSSIRDEAGLFSRRVVEQAQERLDRLEKATGIPVVIETIDHLPGLEPNAPKEQRHERVNEVAKQRDAQIHDEGIYILISKRESVISQPLIRERLEEIVPLSRRDAIRDAFIAEFKKHDFDAGLKRGVEAIERTLEGHHVGGARAAAPAPIGAGRHRAQAGGGTSFMGTFLLIGLGILAVLFLLRILGGLFGRSSGAGYPGQMGGPGAGMGPGSYGGGPGYGGPGYGGRGGGFFSGLLGGLGGAMAGNWLYDQMSGRHGGMTSASSYPVDDAGAADRGDDAIIGAEDHGGQGASWDDPGAGTDTGGGDWGGGGGDWGGGGGDWGGGGDGGGGGDW